MSTKSNIYNSGDYKSESDGGGSDHSHALPAPCLFTGKCMAQVMMDGRMHGSPSESLSLIHGESVYDNVPDDIQVLALPLPLMDPTS